MKYKSLIAYALNQSFNKLKKGEIILFLIIFVIVELFLIIFEIFFSNFH